LGVVDDDGTGLAAIEAVDDATGLAAIDVADDDGTGLGVVDDDGTGFGFVPSAAAARGLIDVTGWPAGWASFSGSTAGGASGVALGLPPFVPGMAVSGASDRSDGGVVFVVSLLTQEVPLERIGGRQIRGRQVGVRSALGI
jgi:hypothetical protein